ASPRFVHPIPALRGGFAGWTERSEFSLEFVHPPVGTRFALLPTQALPLTRLGGLRRLTTLSPQAKERGEPSVRLGRTQDRVSISAEAAIGSRWKLRGARKFLDNAVRFVIWEMHGRHFRAGRFHFRTKPLRHARARPGHPPRK